MADSTMIGLGGYDPYRAKTEATKSFDEYSKAFSTPVQGYASSIGKVDEITRAGKIKEILSNPNLLENGEIDYQQLGTALMPYDEVMAKKYLDLASEQKLKRETLETQKSVYAQKREDQVDIEAKKRDDKAKAEALKNKEELDKWDLTTLPGQEQWYKDYKDAERNLTSASLGSPEKIDIQNRMQNMIKKAVVANALDMLDKYSFVKPDKGWESLLTKTDDKTPPPGQTPPPVKINVESATTQTAVNDAIGTPPSKFKDDASKQWVVANKASVDRNPNIDQVAAKKVIDERFNALSNPPASSNKVAENKAKAYANEFIGASDLKPLIKKITTARQELIGMINQVKNGKYAAVNLAPFKEVMGSLSEGEYGIATNSPIAGLASSIPWVGQSISSLIGVDKFNNQADALKTVNDFIREFNSANAKWRTPSTAANLEGTGIDKTLFDKEMKTNGSYGALLSAIGNEIPALTVGASGKPEEEKTSTLKKPLSSDYKDFGSFQKAMNDYRAKGGK
jgi:hypothetical protein